MSYSSVDEILGLRGRDHVSPDDLEVGVLVLDPADHLDLEDRVALARVEDDDVHPGLLEELEPLLVLLVRGDGRADQELVVLVLRGEGKLAGLLQISTRDEGDELLCKIQIKRMSECYDAM